MRPYAYASVGILLLAGITYPLIRRRRSLPRATGHEAGSPIPVVGAGPRRAMARPPSPGRTELALRKVELVAALAELEAGHQAGRIPEKEYRRLRQEKRRALRDILVQLQEESATGATPAIA
jgi:hypothetical protein